MKINRFISLGKIFAVAILILGIIHDIATFTPLVKGGLACLDRGNLNAMIYMSLICGTSFILSGILLLMLIKKIQKFEFLSSVIFLIGIFLGLSGILSVIYMFDNPFAWIALLLNTGMFLISLGLRFKLINKSTNQ